MQHLETQGLITITHRERSRVNVLYPDLALHQINDILRLLIAAEPGNPGHLRDARRLSETGIVQMSVAKASPADVTWRWS